MKREKELPFNNIYWSFSHEKFNDIEEFQQAVIDYSKEIGKVKSDNLKNLSSTEIIIPQQKIEFAHSSDFFIKEENECWYTIMSDSKDGFTLLELFWKIHNKTTEIGIVDFVYFEGLTSVMSENGIFSIEVHCGN